MNRAPTHCKLSTADAQFHADGVGRKQACFLQGINPRSQPGDAPAHPMWIVNCRNKPLIIIINQIVPGLLSCSDACLCNINTCIMEVEHLRGNSAVCLLRLTYFACMIVSRFTYFPENNIMLSFLAE